MDDNLILQILYVIGCPFAFGTMAYIFHTRIKERWSDFDTPLFHIFSVASMFGSWFTFTTGLCYIYATYLANNKTNYHKSFPKKKLSVELRIARLLRLHFGMVIDTVFTLALATVVVVVYVISN